MKGHAVKSLEKNQNENKTKAYPALSTIPKISSEMRTPCHWHIHVLFLKTSTKSLIKKRTDRVDCSLSICPSRQDF